MKIESDPHSNMSSQRMRKRVEPRLSTNRDAHVRTYVEPYDSDVGSSYPGAGEGPKGLAVRQLKRHASWVQTVVRQVGLYLLQALILEKICP